MRLRGRWGGKRREEERNTKAPRHKGERGKEEERKKPLESLLLLTIDY
jgi:hypothetical protein